VNRIPIFLGFYQIRGEDLNNMKSFRVALTLLMGVSAIAQTPALRVQPDKQAHLRQVLENFGQSALTLEQNRGQAPQNVDFVALGFGHKFLLSPTGATLELFDSSTKTSHLVQMQLVGASSSSRGEGLDRVAFTSAYFSAQDPKGLLRSIPNYAKARYREVWPGIDVVYYGNRDKLEYDMVVAPKADPGSISIKLTGESRFALNSAGDLELQTPYGSVTHHRPLAFQVIDDTRKEVRAGYELIANNEIRIQLGEYDRSHELVIDPTLAISSPTISGGGGAITSVLAGVDGAGNIYTAVSAGQGSIAIFSFGSSGSVINQGTIVGADTTAGMVVTSAGKVYMTGKASGINFPTTNGYQTQLAPADPNGFVRDAYFLQYVGLPNQAVLYGTYFGGVGDDFGSAIAVDAAGNAYITGQTVGGTGFVHTVGAAFAGGGTDAFVAKFNPNLAGAASLIFSTFVGGNGADSGNGIGVDANGNSVYVGGSTTSTSASFAPSSATGFSPSKTTNTNDGFIVKLNSTGASATYLTFLPSAPVNALAVDSSFAAYVTGAVDGTTNVLATTASGFQTTNGGNGCASIAPGSPCTDAYLSKYDTTAGGNASLLYSTYLGGSLSDAGFGVAVDNSGNAYVVGRTNSSNFPTARPLANLATYQGGAIVDNPTLNSQFDAFVAKINTTDAGEPSLVYSTFLGGTDTDQANNVAIDGSGNAFIGGITSSGNFPNTTGSASATGAHGFFSKITDSVAGPTLNITKVHAGNFSQGQTNATYTVTVGNTGTGPTSGTVTVTETVPGGLVLVSMSGTGWSCGAPPTCTRSDALASGGTYPAITVTVNVNGNATSPQVNQVSVSGGGSPAANVSDSTTILGAPVLSITKIHSGAFTQGQQGATYTVTVTNAVGAAATSGTVTVTDTLPAGLSFGSMAGSGWSCTAPTCTRSDALLGGASYPPITVTVNVAGNATSPQNNQVSVSGGGSATANGSDSTAILSAGVSSLSILKSHSGNFSQGQQNATYTVTVSNNNAAASTNAAVTVTDNLPSGLNLVSMAGTGWNCSANSCTRSDALAGGASYPAITVTVNVLGNATSPQVNQVTVSGGGSAPASWSDSTMVNIVTPTLTVNRARLNFGYNGSQLSQITSPQTVTVSISGGLNVPWTASSNRSYVTVSPASGTGSGTFLVTAMAPSGPVTGGAIITVTSPGATGSPQQVQVNVTNAPAAPPFGSFDTPANNTTGIAGSIAVTGWALDNIEVTGVAIWREPITGEATASNGLVFIGNATFVADARPDVAGTYPASPYQYRAGWGYLMLTNFLLNSNGTAGRGNGTYNLHAIMTNRSGAVVDLGVRTITVDNAHAAKPFGAIDTPDQGATATGNAYVNFGWALTQNPFIIPIDGSTITVFVDGLPTGHPAYNQFRSDIATLFPGYANSNGAVGFFYIDTTKLQNKVHTISWSVTDSGNRTDGIGSRYFAVLNANGGGIAAPEEPPTPESLAGPVQLRSGYDLNASAMAIVPGTDGAFSIDMEQFGRIELSLGASTGYLAVGDHAEELPLGSSLKAGVFYWQPPLGFLGKYELLFERPDGTQMRVHVNIAPKSYAIQ
jgi:uncharacterized repeat protein (TIGR01451 family)